MNTKRVTKRRSFNSNKKKINIKNIIFVFCIFIILILSFNIPKIIPSKNKGSDVFKKDEIFNVSNSDKGLFNDLIMNMDKDQNIEKIIFYNKSIDKYFNIPVDLFVSYDDKYYQIKNILNIIKQNRSDNATRNFINFVQDLGGLKIDSFIYKINDDSVNTYYTNNLQKNWDKEVENSNDFVDLNNEYDNSYDGVIYKTIDKNKNDEIIKSKITKYKNIKVELYNSTDISGYGNTMSRLLINNGFTVVRVLNYDTVYPNTVIYSQNNDNDYIDILKNLIGTDKTATDIPINITSIADCIIILGGDTLNLY